MLIVSDSQKCIINEIIMLAASCTQADCVELSFLFGTCIGALHSQLLWVAEQSRRVGRSHATRSSRVSAVNTEQLLWLETEAVLCVTNVIFQCYLIQ